jgi:adenylate cyclase class 2
MDPSRTEVEIKLAFPSPENAIHEIEAIGASTVRDREFEDNRVYDLPDGTLLESRRLLRLRKSGDRAIVTFKSRVPGEQRHKVRIEHETPVGDAEQFDLILRGLGYAEVYRYQKYRSVYRLDGVEISVDETPIGCYVEVEGEPDEIDRVAARLGYGQSDYIRESYRDLHRAHAAARGISMGNLVFSETSG